MRILFLLTAILCISAANAQAQTIKLRDWQAACDEYTNCAATLEIDANAKDYLTPDYSLKLARDAYDTFWTISLITYDATPADNAPVLVELDGSTHTFYPGDTFTAYGALNEYFLLGKPAQQVLDQMVPATSVQFSFLDSESKTRAIDFSLSGLAAAMLWIDEKQTRIGSERVAEAPPSGRAKVTDRAPHPMPDSLKNRDVTLTQCDPVSELPHRNEGESHRLDAEHTLHLIPCFAGAYNFSFQFYLQTQHGVRPIFFAQYNERLGWSGTDALINAYYDPRSQTISAFAKGRGFGDCGTTGLWQWDRWNFRLLEFTAKSNCDGEGYPAEFPVVYRAPDYHPIELE